MKKLELRTEIGSGKDIEVVPLDEAPRRKVIQITLRQDAVLKAHRADVPITVQCIAGTGLFLEVDIGSSIDLSTGVMIAVEPDVLHEVRAFPEVSILVTKFTGDE